MIKAILHGGMAADTAEPISTKINLAQISGFSPHCGVTNASRMRRRVLARTTGRAVMFPLDPPCWQFRMFLERSLSQHFGQISQVQLWPAARAVSQLKKAAGASRQ